MSDPVIELESGFVRGVVENHDDGFNYYSFKGIPYAEPPVGELRFKDPVPIKPWTGVKDCKNYGPECMQYEFLSKAISYSEDCLYLNVFSRTISEANTKTPVIVVIHGGVFTIGSGNDRLYGPEYLIRKDVVLVTFDYRLGVLGFLNLEDEVAPGNLGLRDQLMALQWVQRNIRVFGGDPDNVTVLGMAAGGVSAQCFALSPLAKGLFHKLIVHSNSLYNQWPWLSNTRSNAIKFCSLLGKLLTDPKDIVNFLKTIDTERLFKAQMELWQSTEGTPFSIGVDDKSPNPIVPIVRHESSINQGIHLPCLTGYNSEEAIIVLLGGIYHPASSRKDFFEMCDADFGLMLRWRLRDVTESYGLSVQQLRRLYYQNEAVSYRNSEKYVNLVSDLSFIEGIHKFAKVQAEQSATATYLYVFSYRTSKSIAQSIINDVPQGAAHFDDLSYVFKMQLFDSLGIPHFQRGTRQYEIMEQMTEMWTNFARYGRPTVGISDLTPVHWLPVTDGTVLRHLNIDEDITMQSTLNVEQKLLSAKQIKI